jgi:hypothetical protein
MVTMIPDFARGMVESYRRTAASLDEEILLIEALYGRAQALEELKPGIAALRRRAAREALGATRDIVAESDELRDLWSAAVKSLREGLSSNEQIQMLEVFAELANSGCKLNKAICRLWDLVKRMGGILEGAEELAAAGRFFDQVRSEATKAIKCRSNPWQPADPARYEEGRQEIREGKAVSAEDARARFRGNRQ